MEVESSSYSKINGFGITMHWAWDPLRNSSYRRLKERGLVSLLVALNTWVSSGCLNSIQKGLPWGNSCILCTILNGSPAFASNQKKGELAVIEVLIAQGCKEGLYHWKFTIWFHNSIISWECKMVIFTSIINKSNMLKSDSFNVLFFQILKIYWK